MGKLASTIALMILVVTHLSDIWAHAVVIRSSLTGQSIQADHSIAVELQFNSNIELSLSRAFLVSKGDVEKRVPMGHGNGPGIVKIQLPPMQPGDYAVRYKVFGADGHLTEDIIYFNVTPGKK